MFSKVIRGTQLLTQDVQNLAGALLNQEVRNTFVVALLNLEVRRLYLAVALLNRKIQNLAAALPYQEVRKHYVAQSCFS